jgi:hypothetical protein
MVTVPATGLSSINAVVLLALIVMEGLTLLARGLQLRQGERPDVDEIGPFERLLGRHLSGAATGWLMVASGAVLLILAGLALLGSAGIRL